MTKVTHPVLSVKSRSDQPQSLSSPWLCFLCIISIPAHSFQPHTDYLLRARHWPKCLWTHHHKLVYSLLTRKGMSLPGSHLRPERQSPCHCPRNMQAAFLRFSKLRVLMPVRQGHRGDKNNKAKRESHKVSKYLSVLDTSPNTTGARALLGGSYLQFQGP